MSGDPLLSGKFERDTGGTAGSGIQTLALIRALSGHSSGGGGSNVSGFWADRMHERTAQLAESEAEKNHQRALEISAQEHHQSLAASHAERQGRQEELEHRVGQTHRLFRGLAGGDGRLVPTSMSVSPEGNIDLSRSGPADKGKEKPVKRRFADRTRRRGR